MGEYYVKIDNGILSASTLELDRYYISNEYTANPNISVKVSTNYTETIFEDTEGEVYTDGCLKFSGETKVNNISPDEYFKISSGGTKPNWSNGCTIGWMTAEIESGATASGGTISISIEKNTTENDRDATIFVKFIDKQKKIIIYQYADNSYVTYTVISNAQDNAKITFYDKDNSGRTVSALTSFADGYAEYSRRNISASTITAKIEGGLPESSITYSISTYDGSLQSAVTNSSGTILVNLIETKTSINYSWDENIYSGETTFSINPNETVTKNYYAWQNGESFSGEGHFTVDILKNGGWLAKTKPETENSHELSYSENTYLKSRSATVIFRLFDYPSKSLNYKIIQTDASYTFEFNENATKKGFKFTDSHRILVYKTDDFEAWTLTLSRDAITSTMNGSDFVDYTARVLSNDNDIKVRQTSVGINGTDIVISLPKNVNLNTHTSTIILEQQGSHRTLIIKVIQGPVVCKIGDVYCYSSNGQHSFIDLDENNIPQETTPVGIVVLPMNNKAPQNNSFARVISLTEIESNQDTGTKYGWYHNIENALEAEKDRTWLYNYTGGTTDSYHGKLGSVTKKTNYRTVFSSDNKLRLWFYNNSTKDYMQRIVSLDGKEIELELHHKNGDNNGLYSFNGYERTNGYYSGLTVNYSDWSSDGVITAVKGYSTNSDNTKDWYLGSLGEMACVFQNIDKINGSIEKLGNSKYMKIYTDGTPEVQRKSNGVGHFIASNGTFTSYYWTSTYYKKVSNYNQNDDDKHNATWTINMGSGDVRWSPHYTAKGWGKHRKLIPRNVRPMLLVDKNGNHEPNK